MVLKTLYSNITELWTCGLSLTIMVTISYGSLITAIDPDFLVL